MSKIDAGAWVRVSAVLVMAWATTGCAMVHTGPDGETSIIGFVSLTIPPAPLSGSRLSTGLRVRALGLSVLRTEVGSGVSFGYSDHALLAVGNNMCLRLPPGGGLP